MLIFDQTAQAALNQDGRWRTYKPGVRVKIRPVSSTDQRRFRKEAMIDGSFDQDTFDRLFWDHLVADWEGIVTPDQQLLPLTAANKVAVMTTIQPLGNWACGESDRLAEQEALSEGKKLGNSGSSPAGKRTAPAKETSTSAVTAAG